MNTNRSTDTPLPSWRDTDARRALLDFVARVTTPGGADFVPREARVAVFDNDGTLWCEKPMPIQAAFLLREVGAMADADPSLRDRQPWKAVVTRDHAWLSGVITKHYQGDDRDLKVMAAGLLHAYEGVDVEAFQEAALRYLESSRHPELDRPYLACTYAPMVELLHHLERAGFTNYIASGGGRDFMRPVTQELYGIPPERVIGSAIALTYRDAEPAASVVRVPSLDLFDDGPAKPVRIWSRVGRRPIFAAGNSNGDVPMLRFAEHPAYPSMSLLLLHDDPDREYAYDAGAEEAGATARERRWLLASIARDWSEVFTRAARRTGNRAA